jgi:hypothetical protein
LNLEEKSYDRLGIQLGWVDKKCIQNLLWEATTWKTEKLIGRKQKITLKWILGRHVLKMRAGLKLVRIGVK